MVSGCIKLGTEDKVLTSVGSLQDCEYECIKETAFDCASITYKYVGLTCRMSSRNASTAAADYTAPCSESRGPLYTEAVVSGMASDIYIAAVHRRV